MLDWAHLSQPPLRASSQSLIMEKGRQVKTELSLVNNANHASYSRVLFFQFFLFTVFATSRPYTVYRLYYRRVSVQKSGTTVSYSFTKRRVSHAEI